MTSVKQFWDTIYEVNPTYRLVKTEPKLIAAMDHFGDVAGKTLLEIGCGEGCISLFFAEKGANVIAVDISKVAIDNLNQFCQQHEVKNITAIHCSAFEISNLEPWF